MPDDRQPQPEAPARIAAWTSPRARAALAEWSGRPRAQADLLGLASFLRTRFDAELARELAEQFALRARAKSKFQAPERLVLTRKGLEQATRLDVARWRARRIQDCAPEGPVVDATCGLGADSLALIEAGLAVLALDKDELSARAAAHNLHAATGRRCVVLGSAEALPARAAYLLVDPDRRAGGARSLDPEAWQPPLASVLAAARHVRGACVKLAPGFDFERVLAGRLAGLPALPVWVSAGGELRECGLWTGEWAGGAAPGEREAVVLVEGGAERSLRAVPEQVDGLEPAAAARVRWLAEPDPAVIRSGLLGNVARRARARPLASKLAFLGSDEPIDDPLLEAWPVLASTALDPRRVRRLLEEHDVGEVDLLVRGHPDPPALLAKRLAAGGSRRGFLAVARLERGHQVYLLGR